MSRNIGGEMTLEEENKELKSQLRVALLMQKGMIYLLKNSDPPVTAGTIMAAIAKAKEEEKDDLHNMERCGGIRRLLQGK